MLAARGVDWWIAGATAATALFALAAAVIAWLAYRHAGTQAGSARPVLIAKPRAKAGQFLPKFENGSEDWDRPEEEWGRFRVIDFYMFNRSTVPQQLEVGPWSLDVVWPRFPRHHVPHLMGELPIDFPPYSGGNVALSLVKEDGVWPSQERYLVRLRLETTSGHPVRYLGWVRLRLFRGKWSDWA